MAPKLRPKSKFNLATNELRRLISIGTDKGLWRTVEECGEKVGMKRVTMRDHSYQNLRPQFIIPSIKRVADYLRNNDVPFTLRISLADEQLPAQEKPNEPKAPGPPPKQNAPQESGQIDRLVNAIDNLVARMNEQMAPHDVVTGMLFNELVAGTMECGGHIKDGIRFVLSSENFRRLDGEITDQEIDDTRRLIEELRRRLTVFARLDPVRRKDMRARIYQKLAPEIDHMFVAIRQTEQVIPTSAAAHLEELERAKKLR